MKLIKKIFISAVFLTVFLACTFVEIKPGSEKVSVLKEKTSACKSLGKTRVELGVTSLTADYIQEKLEQLAKNSAVDKQGNSVIEIERISEGVAMFEILNCK